MSFFTDKEITHLVAVSGTWTLTLSEVAGIRVGMRADVGGLPTSSWNQNNVTITAVNTTANTVTYHQGNSTVASQDVWGLFHLAITWVSATQVAQAAGIDIDTLDGDQLAWLEACTEAAEDWAFRRRREAGWNDHPNVVPGHDAAQGVALYAMALYREQGSVDSFQGYSDAPVGGTPGASVAQINRLLSIPRPQVA